VIPEPFHPIIRRYYDACNARRFQDGAALFAADAILEHAPYGPAAEAVTQLISGPA
jgi:hypothetical protein